MLDPDRRYPTNHFVVTSGDALRLQLANVDVDLEAFFEQGNEGLELWAHRQPLEARAGLEAADAAYAGDFLEEDLYEDWAAPVREEVRALYLSVAAALADLADMSRDCDAGIRYRLRILERDPYDESAHLGIVGAMVEAGRHGEARRTYRDYVARMDDIGVEAAPFPTGHEARRASRRSSSS